MPAWQPNWTDVAFDHGKARTAIEQLQRCALLLDHQTDRRVALARAAQQEWRGQARDTFDDELTRMTRSAAWIADALRRLAVRIAEASDTARLEQRRREAERERWYDERRAEDARRAEAHRAGASHPTAPTPR